MKSWWYLLFRPLQRVLPAVALASALSLVSRGEFRSGAAIRWSHAVTIVALGFAIVASTYRRVRRAALGQQQPLVDEVMFGGNVLLAGYVVAGLLGEGAHAFVYAVTAFLVSFLRRPGGVIVLALGAGLEAALWLPNHPATFSVNVGFLALFSALYHLVLGARLHLANRAEDAAVRNRLREVEEHARTFRLVNSGTRDTQTGGAADEKWLVASVQEIEGAVGNVLEIAHQSLEANSCGVFLLSPDDEWLKLQDCRSDADAVLRDRFPAVEGVLGAVLKRRLPMRLHHSNGVKGITYYDSTGPVVRAILAMPLIETNGSMRGVLLADRTVDRPFTDREERLLGFTAREVLRAWEVERVLGYIRRARDEKDTFFHAIEELNQAPTPERVFMAVLDIVRQTVQADFVAVTTVVDAEGVRTHRIARALGVTSAGPALEGKSFPDNHGLVANVVRYGVSLPGRDAVSADRQVIFDDDTQVRGLSSLKIFPLVSGPRILGTLVAGARRKGAFSEEAMRSLEVIAIQAAHAVLRAQMFEQMETMATTDGLTSLLNHRTFQLRLDEALASARRYQRDCALILADIDHFKSVNDTYGHPTGDVVLKGVAKILRQTARDTDAVARYGGEEFAIIMPETSTAGALVIAERIRETVQAHVFQTEQGPLKVTLSLGVAASTEVGGDKRALIDSADQCLYFAKRHGRNRAATAALTAGGRLKAIEGAERAG